MRNAKRDLVFLETEHVKKWPAETKEAVRRIALMKVPGCVRNKKYRDGWTSDVDVWYRANELAKCGCEMLTVRGEGREGREHAERIKCVTAKVEWLFSRLVLENE